MKKKHIPKSISTDKLILELYVSGMSSKSMQAIENIKKICEEYLNGEYELDIIDLYKNPSAASEYNILFCPSLIKRQPLPVKILIGTFSDVGAVLKALDITSNK